MTNFPLYIRVKSHGDQILNLKKLLDWTSIANTTHLKENC